MRNAVRSGLTGLVAALLLGATPVHAGFSGSDLFVPMAGRDAGIFPSDWYTTVWIHDPGSAPATARIYFLERGTANLDPPWVDVPIAAGETQRIDNIVETLFHRGGFGALRITCAAQRLAVTSRTFSKNPTLGDRGSVGQDFAGVPASFAIGAGESTQILGAHQTIPATESDARFNFGFVETTGHSVSVRVTAYDGTGASLGSTELQVRELSQRQVAFKDRFPGVSTENARLEVEVLSGQGKVIAYGSLIANGSQDPTTFEMQYPPHVLAENAPSGVMEVAAGQGLTGGGGAGAVTLNVGAGDGIAVGADAVSVAEGGVTSSKLAAGAVTAPKLSAAGSVAGQGLISSGGTVVWGTVTGPQGPPGPPGPPGTIEKPGFTRSSIDNALPSGAAPSVAIGIDGLGLISYAGGAAHNLRVAHCVDLACSSATASTIDAGDNVGFLSSLTIGSDGLGLISHYDLVNRDLKVAHCANTACSSATSAVVDGAGDVGLMASVTLGADGLGLISYWDETNNDLKVAHCSDVPCSTATTATLDSVGEVGWYTSITVGADGLGLISYVDWSNADLKVAHCADLMCSSATTATIDATPALVKYSSITLGTDGLGLIAYQDGYTAKVAHCLNAACSSASTAVVDGSYNVGDTPAITIGPDGLGLVSYYASPNSAVKVAHCSDVLCSSATALTLDSETDVGLGTSISVGADGLPIVVYRKAAGLRTAHCSNPLCIPYFRRR